MNFYELLLAKQLAGGGGGSAVINPLSVSANGTYSAPEGVDGYNPVEVAVPMPSGVSNISANGDYDIASYASVAVSVPTGVFPSGTSNITANGVYDVTNYASASVNVSGGGGGDTKFADMVARSAYSYEDNTVYKVGDMAFMSYSGLSYVSFPNATKIGISAFASCKALISADFQNITSIDPYAFVYCSLLKAVNAPNLITIGASAFGWCPSLETVNYSKVTTLSSYAFRACSSLTTASFPNATGIPSNTFFGCYNLLSLYLMGSSVATLDNVNAFNSTPIGGYTGSTGGVYGSIFVPSSLYSQYIVANRWSDFAARFVSV